VVGLVLIYFGMGVFGAVFGILMAMVIPFIYLRWQLASYLRGGDFVIADFGRKVTRYSSPLLISTLSTNSLIMTDVLLVKHYFDPHSAGIYASLSTLGKIIFYGTGPISSVMFPLISKRFSENKSFGKVFMMSLVLTSGLSSIFDLPSLSRDFNKNPLWKPISGWLKILIPHGCIFSFIRHCFTFF
jgi:O-antigen/teichoic acid export membrane protein